jgi:glycosyltransferase 2 family protein
LWMLIKRKSFSDLKAMLRRVARSVWQGISAIQHLKKRGRFLFYTLLLWLCYFFSTYLGFYALRETQQYGVQETFALLSAGSIGVIVTPGGIGAYALLIKKTMELYGLQEGVALAFGWILWLVQTFVILIGGVISFVALPYINKKKHIPETA